MDLTFQPRINAESKRILGEGRGEGGATNSFLDRLDNDLRKRQGNKKVCEERLSGERQGSCSCLPLNLCARGTKWREAGGVCARVLLPPHTSRVRRARCALLKNTYLLRRLLQYNECYVADFTAASWTQELERKYYSTDAASGPGATQLQERRDWAVVAEQLQGRCQISLSDAAAEYEEQIDEVRLQGDGREKSGPCQHDVASMVEGSAPPAVALHAARRSCGPSPSV